MTTVSDCWAHYVQHHLPETVGGADNVRFWGRLCWFATYDAEGLSPQEVKQYVAHRGASKPATINRELGLLRACLRHSERHGLIAKAPIIKALPKPAPRMRVLTQKEAGLMIRTADKRGKWREQVYIRLALGTGQRPGAIVDLTWDRVDAVNKVLDFRKPCEKQARMKKRAIVPMNDMVEKAIALARRHRDGPHVLQRAGVQVQYPKYIVKELAKAAGLKDVSPHVLRHTVASLLLQGGEDLLRVSRLLGHASTMVTQTVYFNHPPAFLRVLTDKLKF